MQQIRIGTCIPGSFATQVGSQLAASGFECLALNFHMVYDQGDFGEYAKRVQDSMGETPLPISSIGYYCNALEDESQRQTLIDFIDNAHHFNTNMVTTFAGALEGQSVPAAMPRFKEVFTELAKRAEDRGVTLAFENCPMGGTWQRATCNIAFSPDAWEMMFTEVPSPAIGLEWEPAHQMVQLIDPLPQLRDWAGKVVHMHGKDATIDWDAVRRRGILGAVDFAKSRTPGFGDTNWRDIFFLLFQNGYTGDLCVEGYHDPVFSGEWEMTGQLHALRYLKWCRGGDFTPNPWSL